MTLLACAYASAGMRREAEKVMKELEDVQRGGQYVSPYDKAMIYTCLGNKDLSFEWLEKAREERGFNRFAEDRR